MARRRQLYATTRRCRRRLTRHRPLLRRGDSATACWPMTPLDLAASGGCRQHRASDAGRLIFLHGLSARRARLDMRFPFTFSSYTFTQAS